MTIYLLVTIVLFSKKLILLILSYFFLRNEKCINRGYFLLKILNLHVFMLS